MPFTFSIHPEEFKYYTISANNSGFFYRTLAGVCESQSPQLFVQRTVALPYRITISFRVRVLHHRAGPVHVGNSREDSALHNPLLFSVSLDNILELYETRAYNAREMERNVVSRS